MHRMGIALQDTAGATMYAVTQNNLIMASQSAKLDSPLTLMESGALLDTFPPSGRPVMVDRASHTVLGLGGMLDQAAKQEDVVLPLGLLVSRQLLAA